MTPAAKARRHASYTAWRKRNPDYWRRRAYGLTEGEWDRRLSEQDGKCALCGFVFGEGRADSPQVDHDHVTGKVRGLLCRPCNTAVGDYERLAPNAIRVAMYLSQ